MLTAPQRSYLIRDQMIGPFVINFAINAGIGYLAFRGLGSVPVWGDPSATVDLSVTMFALPLLVCLIATLLLRALLRAGKLPAFADADVASFPSWVMRLPGPLMLRALALGLGTSVVLSPLIVGLFSLSGVTEMGLTAFAVTKGILCGIVALVISPPITLRAVADVVEADGVAEVASAPLD